MQSLCGILRRLLNYRSHNHLDVSTILTQNTWVTKYALAVLPTHYFSTHQCAIRSVAWIRAPTYSAHAKVSHDDPTVIVGSGYDGLLSVCDIREPYGNEIYRTRGRHFPTSISIIGIFIQVQDVIHTVCYSTYSGGPISVDQGQVKVISFAPVMLNKGHTLLDPDGPVWVGRLCFYNAVPD